MDIKNLLNSMTLQEKIGELCLTGSSKDRVLNGISIGKYGSVLNHIGKDHINELQNAALNNNKKIPLLVGDDVIHGYRSVFPVPIGLACTFDLDLIEKLVHMSTEEASTEGINWIYSPMLDLTHDPRWGRIMETAGEDPYYSSLVGERFVKGIQTPLKDGRITAACAKHFIGYGAVEAGLDYNTTDYSEYRLNKLYVPTFKKAIDTGVMSVMNAFTTYNGEAVTGSKRLLKDLLRDELNFKGVVVTDWACIEQLKEHKQFKDDYDACINSIKLGLDIDMHSDVYYRYLEEAVDKNPELLKYIDESVLRVLEMKEKMHLFEHPYVLENAYEVLTKENRNLCLQGAKESIILLKNDDTLPLSNKDKVLFVGPFVEEKDSHLGAWACKGRPEYVTSVYEALKDVPNTFFYPTKFDLSDIDYNALEEQIKLVDKVVLCLGEPRYMNGENNNRLYLDLPFNQEKLVDFVNRFNKKVVTFVFAGRTLILDSLQEKVNSLVFSFSMGIEAGNAAKEVLYGEYNPSGKTVVTFPKTFGQIPIYYNRLTTGRSDIKHYVDGTMDPLYPFGYGLHYGKLNISSSNVVMNDKLEVTLSLENNSNYDIEEVVQIYLAIPYYKYLRPIKELIGFEKVKVEKAKTKELKLTIDLNTFLPNDIDKNIKLGIEIGFDSSNTIKNSIVYKG